MVERMEHDNLVATPFCLQGMQCVPLAEELVLGQKPQKLAYLSAKVVDEVSEGARCCPAELICNCGPDTVYLSHTSMPSVVPVPTR